VLHLVAREFRLRYRQSTLGFLWAVIEPVSRLIVLAFVFTRVVPLHIPNYPVFLFTGLITWAWFSSGIISATTSAVDRRDLLFRPGLPRPIVPIISVLTDGLDYLLALPVLGGFLLFTRGIPIEAVALPIALLPQLLLVTGLGMALAAANVYVRDVNHAVSLAMLVGFYATPVFYKPSTFPAAYRPWVERNPAAQFIGYQRALLVDQYFPFGWSFVKLTIVCFAVFVGGFLVYRAAGQTFVDEL
jgi:lipopolysaccharide transport system permease protein